MRNLCIRDSLYVIRIKIDHLFWCCANQVQTRIFCFFNFSFILKYYGGHVASPSIPGDVKFINMAMEGSRPDAKTPVPIWISTEADLVCELNWIAATLFYITLISCTEACWKQRNSSRVVLEFIITTGESIPVRCSEGMGSIPAVNFSLFQVRDMLIIT